ncbi:MurR/RpiR family transcriptional regulator [Stappia sp. WLB 29]|uniref:MurR/RpiR family transcriptional regulator n=1 Tax=Stappia sp. WLB 29 TaxID=2925220 RepID=UPI0020BD8692|nr:MurR/RpiR family transcriptional regulator [Stappia sp. WLB 29]
MSDKDVGTAEEAAPPRDYDGLRALLIERKPAMPKRLAQVAAFAVDRPDDVTFGTVAVIAEQAGVQPSTLVRFAQSLGYQGFSELQDVFRARLRERWPEYDERLEVLRRRSGDSNGAHALFGDFVDTAVASLLRMRNSLAPDVMEEAARAMARARVIYLVAQRRAFPVSAYMAYALSKLGMAAVLVDNLASLGPEQASAAGPQDLLVAVSFTPYASLTVDVANAAAARGVPVLALTDSPFSPLIQSAKVVVEVAEADLGAFRSLSGTLCLAMALCVAAAEMRRDGVGEER